MVIKPEGGFIQTWISHRDPDWATNATAYHFGPFQDKGFEWALDKHADGSASVWISGPFGQTFQADMATIPPSPGSAEPGKRAALMIEWKDGVLRIRLNMIAIATLHAQPATTVR